MLSGEVTQTDLALSERGPAKVLDLIGLLDERQEPLPRRMRQEWVALDGAIDEADDYPSKAGLLAMFAAALFGMVVLAALYLLFYDPSSY